MGLGTRVGVEVGERVGVVVGGIGVVEACTPNGLTVEVVDVPATEEIAVGGYTVAKGYTS